MAPPTNNPVASFLKDLKKKHKKKTRDRKEFHKSHKKEHEHVKEKKRKQPTQSDNVLVERPSKRQNKSSLSKSPLTFPIRYMCAPMVGASELAFRLLCRKYGCETAYTPMMSAHEFAIDRQYRKENFQTCAQDRPLVCHFSANTPADFSAAAVQAAPYCDAIDLNLGCPQRGAFLNHFGSCECPVKTI
jgi:tRNA-dihydrouridine synthase 1